MFDKAYNNSDRNVWHLDPLPFAIDQIIIPKSEKHLLMSKYPTKSRCSIRSVNINDMQVMICNKKNGLRCKRIRFTSIIEKFHVLSTQIVKFVIKL
jgi:hypothetical protein